MRGAAILDKQIEERAQERRRQEELRDQERQQMVAELERMKEEELEQQHEKRIAANKLVRETARANAAAIDKKKWLIQAEKEEDARIARYIKEKVRCIRLRACNHIHVHAFPPGMPRGFLCRRQRMEIVVNWRWWLGGGGKEETG